MSLLPVLRCCVAVRCFSAVLLLLVIALVHARTVPESQRKVCRSDDFLRIQKTCSRQNDDFLLAVKRHDNGGVCSKLVELFYCVAGHVPLCFHNVTGIYKSYFHSPHNCALSRQQIISLQNLTTHTAQTQGAQGTVDVEVDIIVPVSTTTMETSSEEEGGEGRGYEEGRGGGGGMRHEEQSGWEGPSSGSSPTSLSTIPLVVTSCVVAAWRMTSSLLLS
ncbi:hypothetical protein ACOMHN_059254 [Nucella lapillus]